MSNLAENYYWFSFSHEGGNAGVCIVQANDEDQALQKTIELDIHPAHDHIACFQIEDLESGMEINILYTPEDMVNMNYESHKEVI